MVVAVISVVLPFLSPKSYSKIQPVPTLLSLYLAQGVPLYGIAPTLEVLHEEARAMRARPDSSRTSRRGPSPKADSSGGTFASTLSAASSYLMMPRSGVTVPDPSLEGPKRGEGYWGRSLDDLVSEAGGKVPRLLDELSRVILGECTTTEGIFRRASNVSMRSVFFWRRESLMY